MAQGRTGYRSIDDTEVDAESPITESLMFALRDQWVGGLCDSSTLAPSSEKVHVPERAKTTETDTRLALGPDGSGGTQWWLVLRDAELDTASSIALNSTSWTDVLDFNITGIEATYLEHEIELSFYLADSVEGTVLFFKRENASWSSAARAFGTATTGTSEINIGGFRVQVSITTDHVYVKCKHDASTTLSSMIGKLTADTITQP